MTMITMILVMTIMLIEIMTYNDNDEGMNDSRDDDRD